MRALTLIVEEACAGLDGVDAAPVLSEIHRNLYDGISQDELALAPIMAARTLVEQEPNYAYASARLLLDKLRTEVLSFVHGAPINASQAEMADALCRIISRPTSRPASRPSCSILIWPVSTSSGSPPR